MLTLHTVAWPQGAFPTDEVIGMVTPDTGMIVVISPNNPTGAVATERDLRRLSKAAPHALLAVDLAYGPFADVNLIPTILELPNAVALLTFSKAYGMAGLRLGATVGPLEIIDNLRVAGFPFPVSSLSLVVAEKWLDEGVSFRETYIAKIKEQRTRLESILTELNERPLPSQANFVFTECRDPLWVRDALAGMGIAVRYFPDSEYEREGVRVTLPGEDEPFDRLEHGLRTALAPEALLFDMDGVLADVSGSYRETIVRTAAGFGVEVTGEQIASAKREEGANDDWVVTQRLIERGGVQADLEEVIRRFEEIYQGTDDNPGLHQTETLRIQI